MPSRIGRYTIVRVLGEGGMGTVYEAVQENPKRTVALKVIKAGYLSPALLRRFEQESQVLGRLQHPGIAQVYEAGVFANPERERRAASALDDQVTSASPVAFGTPFFAMEFIRGIPLTDYATQKNLTTRDRLELLAKVCDAVYHAHQKGVIHRDLKPGNILVDDSGQPKILDFGVARATDSDLQQTTIQTDIGAIIGTVPYMSPEQVGGDPDDLDTRSDVYALGVIAYELLAGRLPYDLQRKMIHEAARIIREEEPTRLSSINRTLRGDIETIVTHALEKDKVRRYQSAESLASDIRRYLKDEPIAARPASTWYQAAKFAKRNTGLVSGLAAAFILLIAGLAGTGYGLRQAITARDSERAARTEAEIQKDAALTAKESEAKERTKAEAQRDKAEKIAEFMSDTLKGAGPSVARGRDITMLKEMMDAAAARIEKGDLKSAPEAELRLRRTIGDTYRQLAAYDGAARMLEPALASAKAIHSGDHADVAASLNDLAALLKDRGDLAAAEPLYRESLEMTKRLSPSGDQNVAAGLNNLGRVLHDRGDLAAAEVLLREAVDTWQRAMPRDHPNLAEGLSNLAMLLGDRGDPAGAVPFCRESLEIKKRLFPGDHPGVAADLNNLAMLLQSSGDLASAEPFARESVQMRKRLFLGDHPTVASGLNNLAQVLMARGDLEGAESLVRESTEMNKRLFRGDHPDVALGLNNLAFLVQARGDLAEAESLFREGIEMQRRLYPGDHPRVAAGLSNLAILLRARGDLAGAELLFRDSLEMKERIFPGDHPSVATGINNLAALLETRGDTAGAESLFRKSLDMRKRLFPGDHPDVAASLYNLACMLQSRGDLADAEPLFRESLGMYRRALGETHPSTLRSLYCVASLLIKSDRYAEALPLVETCINENTKNFGAAHKGARDAIGLAVALYESWNKAEPGKGYDTKAAEWKAKLDAITPPEAEAPPPG